MTTDARAAARQVLDTHTPTVVAAMRPNRYLPGRKRYAYCSVDQEPYPCSAIVVAAEIERQAGVVTHRCPRVGSGITQCCGRSPFAMSSDRMTLYPQLVNCPGARP
jgi:hypothetical protein